MAVKSSVNKVAQLVGPTVEALGLQLWGIEHTSQGKYSVLRIFIERDSGVTIDDCEQVSRQVSAILDVEDPISGAFTLEVSSPGLDRPLVRQKDFERYTGLEAKVELRQALNGQRRYRGVLAGYADGVVKIVTENGATDLPFDEIDKAKLIITDELLAAGSAD